MKIACTRPRPQAGAGAQLSQRRHRRRVDPSDEPASRGNRGDLGGTRVPGISYGTHMPTPLEGTSGGVAERMASASELPVRAKMAAVSSS